MQELRSPVDAQFVPNVQLFDTPNKPVIKFWCLTSLVPTHASKLSPCSGSCMKTCYLSLHMMQEAVRA